MGSNHLAIGVVRQRRAGLAERIDYCEPVSTCIVSQRRNMAQRIRGRQRLAEGRVVRDRRRLVQRVLERKHIALGIIGGGPDFAALVGYGEPVLLRIVGIRSAETCWVNFACEQPARIVVRNRLPARPSDDRVRGIVGIADGFVRWVLYEQHGTRFRHVGLNLIELCVRPQNPSP